MTRKHFQAIADVIRKYGGDEGRKALMALEMAATLRQFNPNFDRERFIRACTEEPKAKRK